MSGGTREIPKEWEVVQLKSVIEEIKNGFACGKRDDNGMVQIRMNNVTPDGRLIFDSFLKVPMSENISQFLLKENDFLFNNTNSIDLVGKSTIFKEAPFPCTFSNHFTRIRFTKRVLPEWVLFHFVTMWRKGFFKSVAIRHVGQAAVHTKYLLNVKIPLPPLPEQQKIAEILSTVDKGIEKVDEGIEKTQRLKRGLMQELLTRGIGHKEFKDTEIGRIPKEWEVVRLREMGELQYGYTTSAIKKNTGTKLLRITDIEDDGRVDWKDVPYCEIHKDDYEKYKVIPGDVLFTRIGATTGKATYVNKEVNGVFASYLIRFKLSVKSMNTKFLHYCTQSNLYWSQVHRNREGQLKKGLNAKVLGRLTFPLPPLPEQKKIAEILSTVDKRLELLREKKGKLERVKKGLMNGLLTGKKRVGRVDGVES